MTTLPLPLESFWLDFKARGLGGLTAAGTVTPSGIDSPAAVSAYWYNGDANSKPSYTNGTYNVAWVAAVASPPAAGYWRVVAAAAPTVALFIRAAASVAGTYAAQTGQGTGTLTITEDPVWPRKRYGAGLVSPGTTEGTATDVPQTVLTEYGLKNMDAARAFEVYNIQADSWHTNDRVADARCQAIFESYDALKDPTSASQGLALTGWRAVCVSAEKVGVLESLQLTGGARLWKAVATIQLRTFVRT
jgi:hypothetical protein